jgi:hypothetical protein
MPPEATILRFDPIQHRYWTGPRELLAVTQVLLTAGVIDSLWFTPAARDRGARVHAALEQLERHELYTIDPAYEPYVEGYRQFLHDARPVWHGIETPVADLALGYAGRPDRWGTLQGDPVVVEIKTGTVPSWASLQLVAYARLALDGQPVVRRRRLVVQLLPTGRYTTREYPVINFGRDERVFLAALAVAQWKRAA